MSIWGVWGCCFFFFFLCSACQFISIIDAGRHIHTVHTVCSSIWMLLKCPKILLQRAMSMYTCTFHFPKFHSAHRSAPSESRISLWQQNENSAAAQPLIGIKRHTPKQFSANLWLWQACQTSHQRFALRAEGKKTEDQRQEVSVSTCWFRRAERQVFFWGGCLFVCLFVPLSTLDLSVQKKKKMRRYTLQIGR